MHAQLYPEEAMSLAEYNPDERRISIFADSERGKQDAIAIVERMGARVLFAGSVDDGLGRLADYAVGDAVFVDIGGGGNASVDALLDRLDALAGSERLAVIVNCAPECLDQAAARLSAPSVTLMSQATAADWVSAMSIAGTMREPVLHEIGVDDSLRLQRLANEVQRIAATLAGLVGNDPMPIRSVSDALIGFRADPVSYMPASPVSASEVRTIIRARRMRDRFFRGDLFADPAWDMLLDLMAARLDHMRVAVSSLCIAAAVPPTTALRWIKTMCDNGMFVRVADSEDGRRVFIELSEGAAMGMNAYFSATKAQGGLAV